MPECADGLTFQLLWLMSRLREENRLEILAGMLERPHAETAMLVERLVDRGAVRRAGEHHVLTGDGQKLLERLRSVGAASAGGVRAEEMACYDEGCPEAACRLCLRAMREAHRRYGGAAITGWLDLLLTRLADCLHGPLRDAHDLAELVLGATGAAIYYCRCTERVRETLAKAAALAAAVGNSHLLCQLTFARGALAFFTRSGNFAEALALCAEATGLLDGLADPELEDICRPFRLLRHFLAGEHHQVMDTYELMRRQARAPQLPFLEAQMMVLASSSAAYLGSLADAEGMLKSAAATAEIEDLGVHGLLFRQHLGVLQAYMHHPDAALATLEAVLADPLVSETPKIMLRARVGIALCHARQGKVKLSWEVLARVFAAARHDLGLSLPWNYPWMLELAVMFESNGLPGLEDLDFRSHVERGIRSSNPFVRGCTLRFQAEAGFHRHEPPAVILPLLENAIAALARADTPLELGMAFLLKSRILSEAGEHDGAAAAAAQAKAWLDPLGLDWAAAREQAPELQERRQGALPAKQAAPPLFPRLCAEFGAFEDWRTLEEYCNGAAAILRRIFDAECAAVFRVRDGTLTSPGLCNISPLELKRGRFAGMGAQAVDLAKEVDPVITNQEGSWAAFVPFRLSDTDLWLVYAAGRNGLLPSFGLEALRHTGTFCAMQIRNVLRLERELRGKTAAAPAPLEEDAEVDFVRGRSRTFALCLERARLAAPTDAAVLLRGETGVGKELVAGYIHRHSGRSGPLVCVHPAAMNETLFENEFFGHEKGAFTGAHERKIGFFELADKGTLFIDEVGEIPLAMQSKLLRVLQERRFTRVGGTREIESSFRLLAATNRDLEAAVAAGTFREDLYYRIAVFPVHIPALRERPEDIGELFRHYAAFFARRYGRRAPALGEATLELLRGYAWPGNIRELKNAVERAVILSTDVTASFLQGDAKQGQADGDGLADRFYGDLPDMKTLERRYLTYVLERAGGRVDGPDGAAAVLGMSRSTLYARLREWGLAPGRRNAGSGQEM